MVMLYCRWYCTNQWPQSQDTQLKKLNGFNGKFHARFYLIHWLGLTCGFLCIMACRYQTFPRKTAFLSCLRLARTIHIFKLFSIVACNPVSLPGSLLFLISKISAANSDEEHMSAPQSLPWEMLELLHLVLLSNILKQLTTAHITK